MTTEKVQPAFTAKDLEMIIEGLYMLENESFYDSSDPEWQAVVKKVKELQEQQ